MKVLSNVEELLGAGEELNLEAMNGTDILFDGWIGVRLKLAGDDTTADELRVPVLVGQKEQEYSIIGFNVIEEILSQHSKNSQAVSDIIQQSFPSVHHTQVGARLNLIQSRLSDTRTTAVKVGKRDVMLPRGEATKAKCQIHFGPVLVQSLNSPFFPPHIGAEPGRAKRRVQDNLHAHARNAAIFSPQIDFAE